MKMAGKPKSKSINRLTFLQLTLVIFATASKAASKKMKNLRKPLQIILQEVNALSRS
jgi:hypothetical protein